MSGQYVRIPYKTASFDITYECLSYVAPGKNRYAYKIDNIMSDWIYTDKMSVSLINLPHGKYRFRVKSANNDGVWSVNECSVGLDIRPAPWQTVWAKILYAMIFMAAAALLYINRELRNRKKRLREKREMELAAEQELYKAKLQFFTHIAHEIKTPVSLIKAPLQAIEASGEWNRETQVNISVIKKNTERLLELIRQLLDFRKADNDAYKLTYSKADLNSLIEDTIARFRPSAGDRISITADLPDEHLIYSVDSEALIKIVSNLLNNALKFARSVISISMKETIDGNKKYVRICVRDNGPGIEPDEASKIFEPFFQSSKNGSGSTSGVGIGLSLVRLLAEKHSGRVFLDDSAGEGFAVCVELPDHEGNDATFPADGKIAVEPVAEEPERGRNDWNILIVEDNEDMLEFLARNLGNEYNIDTARNGRDALEIIKSRGADLIVSDIVMPEMDGFELLQAIRSDRMLCHIPFILLSARDSIESKIRGLDNGADAYLEKPFSLDHVRATINSLLENRRLIFDRFANTPGLEYEKVNIRRSDMEWLDRLNREITRNFTNDNFTVDTLVSQMAMSRSNLQRKLKGLTGLPPNDYIRLIRLKTAAQYLRDGRYRVNEEDIWSDLQTSHILPDVSRSSSESCLKSMQAGTNTGKKSNDHIVRFRYLLHRGDVITTSTDTYQSGYSDTPAGIIFVYFDY